MQCRSLSAALAAILLGVCFGSPLRAAEDTIKIGYMDPFSGAAAQIGDANLQAYRFSLDYVNAHEPPLGKKLELVAFDHKFQPAEALIALKQIIDQNMPFVLTTGGSNVAAYLCNKMLKEPFVLRVLDTFTGSAVHVGSQ